MPVHIQHNDTDLNTRYKRCLIKKKPSNIIKSRRWSSKENELFWQALEIVGQDFSMMESWFKCKNQKRSKTELKSKFHREDKHFSSRINSCLKIATKRKLKESDFKEEDKAKNKAGQQGTTQAAATAVAAS